MAETRGSFVLCKQNILVGFFFLEVIQAKHFILDFWCSQLTARGVLLIFQAVEICVLDRIDGWQGLIYTTNSLLLWSCWFVVFSCSAHAGLCFPALAILVCVCFPALAMLVLCFPALFWQTPLVSSGSTLVMFWGF